jgi:glycosyltransferase involved in cell wall biosynthesis
MRIAYLSHQSGVGSEMALARLLSRLARVEPVVVLPEDGPLRGELERLGIPVQILPLAWWIPATHWNAERFLAQLEGLDERAAALEAWLKEERIGAVHTNTIVTLEGALAAARLGLPHVWHSRGFFGGGFPPAYLDDTGFFFSAVDLLADALVCVSRGVERQAAASCRLADRHVVYDGFDLDRFLARPVEERGAVLARYGIAEDARVVACVGGLQRRKGQLDLVEAAREIPGVLFALAGAEADAEYVAALKARIAELGLGERFRFVGFEPNVRDLLSISEVLVHPSHSEGFGLAILEAMAMGLPVVATRCGGPEEIVEDGVSGLLVPPESPRELAAALRRALADPGDLGKQAAERARAFSLESTARRMEEIYAGLAVPSAEKRAIRARLADFVTDQVLTRARLAIPAAPPPSPHSPRSGSWLSRLRRRSPGSTS